MDKKASHAADSLRSSDLPETDKALRDDVNRVGSLVGEILAEQEGEDFLDEVERILKPLRIKATRVRRDLEAWISQADQDGAAPATLPGWLELFLERGYAETTVAEIIETSGVLDGRTPWYPGRDTKTEKESLEA